MASRRRSAKLVAITLLLALPAFGAMAAEAPRHTISTVAGTGQPGSSGDGGPATAAALANPGGVAALPGGGFLVADTAGNRVRRVDAQGRIATVAGTGAAGFAGDGGPATRAQLNGPTGVAAGANGGFLVADTRNGRIRHVAPNGTIATVAGNGRLVDGLFGGEGGRARSTHLEHPRGVALAPGGGFLIADTGHHAVRRVSPTGTIRTLVGGMRAPHDVAATRDGGVLIADTGNNRVVTIGSRTAGVGGLNAPRGLAALPDGGYLVADTGNNRIRRAFPDGSVHTLAGTSAAGYGGDGGPPRAARLNAPADVAVGPGGRFLIADSRNHRVRLIDRAPAAFRPPPGGGEAGRLAAPAKPRLGKSFNVRKGRGLVRVKLPRSKRFVELLGAASIPVGSLVDASAGSVRLTVARDRRGKTQSGRFWSGGFRLLQSGGRRPMTELALRGGELAGCPSARGAVASAKRRRRGRRLWSRVKGRFRTRGRHGVATVRGTTWLTEDRCNGTLVAVRSGRVAVRDLTRRKTYLVTAGRKHFSPVARRKR